MRNTSFLFILILLFAGCLPKLEPEPKRLTCDVKTILLEKSLFPGQVDALPIEAPIPEAPPDSAERIFHMETETSVDVIQQYIMNFGSVARASDFFKNREEQIFKTDADRGSWQTPEGLLDFSFAADQSHVACGVVLSSKTCRWLARYSGHYLYLRSDISESGMTVDIFADAVQEIDARMVRCLEK